MVTQSQLESESQPFAVAESQSQPQPLAESKSQPQPLAVLEPAAQL